MGAMGATDGDTSDGDTSKVTHLTVTTWHLIPRTQAALALHRFGLGPRAGSVAAIASDPRGALIAELDRAGAGRIAAPDLMSSGAAARAAVEFREAQRQMRREASGSSNRRAAEERAA